MNPNSIEGNNIAETIAREARKPAIVHTLGNDLDGQTIIAAPAGFTLHTIDTEPLMAAPRRKKGAGSFDDAPSFLHFVARHKTDKTLVWCEFDPVTHHLKFKAVLDDHGTEAAGWRCLWATYEPAKSVEFGRWSRMNQKTMAQVEFAEWIERNSDDIASVEGRPTSLDMLKMATEFEVSADLRLKSHTRLQNGSVRMEFVDQENSETVQRMSVFEKFALGLPVFRNASAFRIDARLRYRAREGKVTFTYELLRDDKVVEAAARELIAQVREGLGGVPLLMGEFS